MGLGVGAIAMMATVFISPALVCWLVCALLLCLLLLVAIGVPAAAVGMYVVSRQAPPKPLIAPQNALGNTLRYWAAVAKGGDAEVFGSAAAADERKEADGDEHGMALRRARLQTWQVRLVFQLWDAKHYRCDSFAQDLRDNLRNLALPGTVLPLSLWVSFKWTAWVFALVVNPLACLISAFAVLVCDKEVRDPLSNLPAFLKESLELCKRAHEELCPSAPLAGWDVVLVEEEEGKVRIAPLLLEVNLSCNFFLGSFDEPWYFR